MGRKARLKKERNKKYADEITTEAFKNTSITWEEIKRDFEKMKLMLQIYKN